MRIPMMIAAAMLACTAAIGAQESRPAPLRILFVGEAHLAPRTEAFRAFLAERFRSVRTTTHAAMTPELAKDADVVILDWHQGQENPFPPKASPLGTREAWTKPTVLLGSAGLFTACIWKVNGGSG